MGRGRVAVRLWLAGAALLALGGATVLVAVVSARPERSFADSLGPVGRPGCRGVQYDPRLHYGPRRLSSFVGQRALCEAWWVPGANARLVPQGMALDGDTVWVTGYRWKPRYGNRPCRLVQIDTRTGRALASVPRLVGSAGGRDPTYCRHGGGVVRNHYGLWVVETMRLWLVDPDAAGTGRDPVRRVWAINRPLRGSTILDDGRHLGLGQFYPSGLGSRGGHGRYAGRGVVWFDVADLMAPGVTDLVQGDPLAGQVAPRRTTTAPAMLQGGTVGPHGGVYLTASTTRCGVIVRPGGRRVAAPPGIEGIAIDGDGDVWALSESASLDYQRKGGRPLVPMLGRYGHVLLDGPRPRCRP